jgi:poly(A) polymerase
VVEPVVLPRPEHTLSRKDIDADALKVLHRLHGEGFVAYLVGGSVRDLLLGRRPKDFDIGTSAHPYQVKRLFRNCWIIGRRFRLAHVKFGTKTIEVATFRRQVPLGAVEPAEPLSPEQDLEGVEPTAEPRPIERDNEFGTPEEDAFRRDFTVNALFYDIATFSIIDYCGGLEDLEKRVIRSIGDPMVRFVEDPVRMLRAGVFAARLGFTIDDIVLDAIHRLKPLIAKSSPARLLEEYYKILRSGYAEASFRMLHEIGLLQLMTPELKKPSDGVWEALARLDAYRRKFDAPPPELNNTLLMGTLLAPLGLAGRRQASAEARVQLGLLPIARRDLDRLAQVLTMLPRLTDPELPSRIAKGLPNRPAFGDALAWLQIFGDAPEVVDQWTAVREAMPKPVESESTEADPAGRKRRRRRGRRRGRGRGAADAKPAE